MAKQVGEIKIVGTFADITFYKMDGQYYARMKSSLTGKRVKRDPRFARTMQSAHRLGRGSQLASKVYHSLPRAERVYALYKELKSMAVLALKEGKREAEVLALLHQHLGKVATPKRVGAASVYTKARSTPKALKGTLPLQKVYDRVVTQRKTKRSNKKCLCMLQYVHPQRE